MIARTPATVTVPLNATGPTIIAFSAAAMVTVCVFVVWFKKNPPAAPSSKPFAVIIDVSTPDTSNRIVSSSELSST